MRRGTRGRGHGTSNSMGRSSEMPRPLMSEHIRDIDLELELLKRKREMIEQQQYLDRQISYNDQRQHITPLFGSTRRSDPVPNRNFSLMYDDHPSPDYIPLNSGSRKRPSEPIWRDNPQPKRFSGPSPKRGNSKSFGSRSGSNANPASGSSAQQRYFEPKPMSAQVRPFNQKPRITPTKSFKAKPGPPPNRLASRPMAERKALVTEAVKAVNQAMVLRPDSEPSLQLNGRLELALGHLLKEIKTKYGSVHPYSINFLTQITMKPMKKLIRERIRDVMMGKEVKGLPDIIQQYREKYPHETDVDIVNEGLARQEVGNVKLITKSLTTETPKDYFKVNISLMIDQKLHQMFLKLSEIYAKDAPRGDTVVDLTIQKPGKLEDEDFSKDVIIDLEENPTNDVEGEQSKDDISKDKEETVEEIIDPAPEEQKGTEEEPKVENVSEEKNEIVAEKTVENGLEDKAKKVTKATDKNKTTDSNELPDKETVVLDRLIEQKLPEILKKHIRYIRSLLNVEEMYESLDMRRDYKVDRIKKSPPKPKVPQDPPKYFVKIYGRKGFPRKNAMQEFLNKFKPKTVKKHKAMNNLLFVGFDDKESFDKILAEDGVIMGRSTLQITVSENKKKKSDGQDDGDVTIIEDDDAKSANSSQDEKILSAEIDNQITDLLTSIKEAEESPNTSITVEEIDGTQNENTSENAVKADPENDVEMKEVEESGDNKQDNHEKVSENITESNIVKSEPKTPTKKESEVSTEKVEENSEMADEAANNAVDSVKNDATAKGTPTRASSRIAAATPSTIRTRRASRLAQNNQ